MTTTQDYSHTYNFKSHTAENNLGIYGHKEELNVKPKAAMVSGWTPHDSIGPVDPDSYYDYDIVPPSDITPAKKVSQLELYHQTICDEIDSILALKTDEEAFDKSQFERLQKVMNKYNALMMHSCAQSHHAFIHAMNDQTMEIARKIQKTYNTWISVAITSVSATLSIAGGFAGIAPLTGAFTPAVASALSSAAHGLSSAGNGTSAIGTIFDKRSEGERVILNVELRRAEALESEHKDSRRQQNQKAEQINGQEAEKIRAEADLWRTFAGG